MRVPEVATDEFPGQNVMSMTDREIVDGEDFVPFVGEHQNHMRADVACSPRYENSCHVGYSVNPDCTVNPNRFPGNVRARLLTDSRQKAYNKTP